MSWSFQSGIPIYAQLTEGIKTRIISGAYPAGSRLPSVRELAAEAGVNPNTMQRALSMLEQEGYLRTERTNGRFVTDDVEQLADSKKQVAREKIQTFLEQMTELGISPQEVVAFIQEKEG